MLSSYKAPGQEGISRLFRLQLELLSEDPAIRFDPIVGQTVTITRCWPMAANATSTASSSRFAQSGSDKRFTSYHAEVVPWLWFLTRTADCRIFQKHDRTRHYQQDL